jgi:Mn-containing catalase
MMQEQLGGSHGELKAAMQYISQSFRINDQGVMDTKDFLLNPEEAHNTMFREAFNRIKDTGSLKDWGVTNDSRLCFDLSSPGGQYFAPDNNPQPPSFNNPTS